jgi:hypothetical protein
MRWLSALVLAVAGCWTTEPSVKPPPQPEQLIVPPADESRWSAPVEYPKGTLFKDTIKKKDEPTGPGGPNGPPGPLGSGPGMKGY